MDRTDVTVLTRMWGGGASVVWTQGHGTGRRTVLASRPWKSRTEAAGTRVADPPLPLLSGRTGLGWGCLCQLSSVPPAAEVRVSLFLPWGRRWEGIRSTAHSTLSQYPRGKAPEPCGGPQPASQPQSFRVFPRLAQTPPDEHRVALLSGGVFHQPWGGKHLTIISVGTLKSKHPAYLSEPPWKVHLGSVTHIRPEREAGVVALQRH